MRWWLLALGLVVSAPAMAQGTGPVPPMPLAVGAGSTRVAVSQRTTPACGRSLAGAWVLRASASSAEPVFPPVRLGPAFRKPRVDAEPAPPRIVAPLKLWVLGPDGWAEAVPERLPTLEVDTSLLPPARAERPEHP